MLILRSTMATSVMHPVHPPMDRHPSFEQARAHSTPPFRQSPFDAAPPASVRQLHYRLAAPHNPLFDYTPEPDRFANPHHASSSGSGPLYASHSQGDPPSRGPPFAPYQHHHSVQGPPTSPPTGIPFASQALHHPHADSPYLPTGQDAWTMAYHQMMLSSWASGGIHEGGVTPPPTLDRPGYFEPHRRTNSGPDPSSPPRPLLHHSTPPLGSGAFAQHVDLHVPPHVATPPPYHQSAPTKPLTQAFHPYKRLPQRRTSQDTTGVPRSISQPSNLGLLQPDHRAHKRSASLDSGMTTASTPRPEISKSTSVQSKKLVEAPVAATEMRNDTRDARNLHGKADNLDPQHLSTSKPTPLAPVSVNTSNVPVVPIPADEDAKERKSGGLKNKLKKVLGDRSAKTSTPTAKLVKSASASSQLAPKVSEETLRASSDTAVGVASPGSTSIASTRSATPPPATPPQHDSHVERFTRHIAPSSVSLAETDQTLPAGEPKKRSLFRMKNLSTDNISLASTVSSASMMIRKMGSLGKLARRNS